MTYELHVLEVLDVRR